MCQETFYLKTSLSLNFPIELIHKSDIKKEQGNLFHESYIIEATGFCLLFKPKIQSKEKKEVNWTK